MLVKSAVWNSVADEAIWRECRRAVVDRSLDSRTGRSPWAVRASLILVSKALSRVVVAPAGAAPTRAVDAMTVSAASRESRRRRRRTGQSFGRGRNNPRAAFVFPPGRVVYPARRPAPTRLIRTIWHTLTNTEQSHGVTESDIDQAGRSSRLPQTCSGRAS